MPKKTRLPPIGDSSDGRRLKGGETWRLVDEPTKRIGLHKDDRIRIEDRPGPYNATMFPDKGTELYEAGYRKIELLEAPTLGTGIAYEYTGLVDGKPTQLWISEGGVDPAEATITDRDPNIGGGNGGIAGIRR